MELYRGRGREVLKSVINLLDSEFDRSNLDSSIATAHRDASLYYHTNPSRDVRYPYAFIWASNVEESGETKDDVQLEYTYSVEIYDRSNPIGGSSSAGSVSLYEEIHRVIKNNYESLATDRFKVLWVVFNSFNITKQIDDGAVGWDASGSFTIVVQHF